MDNDEICDNLVERQEKIKHLKSMGQTIIDNAESTECLIIGCTDKYGDVQTVTYGDLATQLGISCILQKVIEKSFYED